MGPGGGVAAPVRALPARPARAREAATDVQRSVRGLGPPGSGLRFPLASVFLRRFSLQVSSRRFRFWCGAAGFVTSSFFEAVFEEAC